MNKLVFMGVRCTSCWEQNVATVVDWKPIEGRRRNHSRQTSEKQKSRSVPPCWNFITATHHVTHQSALLRMSRPLASQQVAPDGSPPTPGSGISELLDSLWPCFRTSDVRYSNGINTFYTLHATNGWAWHPPWERHPGTKQRVRVPLTMTCRSTCSSKDIPPQTQCQTSHAWWFYRRENVHSISRHAPVTCAECQRALTFKANRVPVATC